MTVILWLKRSRWILVFCAMQSIEFHPLHQQFVLIWIQYFITIVFLYYYLSLTTGDKIPSQTIMLNSRNKRKQYVFQHIVSQSAIHLSLWLLSYRNASQESSPEQGAGSPTRSKTQKMFLLGEASLTPQPKWLLCCLLKIMGMPNLFRSGICKVFFTLSLFLFWSKKPRDAWAKYLWDIHFPL